MSERDAAVREAEEARARLEELTREVAALREERKQVRSRIEKLLGHLEVLSSA